MTTSFWIKSITFSGEDVETSTVNFKPGFNIIHGASDTGKTYLARSIEYMLVGATRPIPEETGYTHIQMVVQAGEREITFKRKMGTSKMDVSGAQSLGIFTDTYPVANTDKRPDDFTVSDILLYLIGIKQPVDIVTNQYGNKKKMSWRSFSGTLYRNESQITAEQSIFQEDKYETLSALAVLFDDADFALVKKVPDPAEQKRTKEVLTPYLDSQLLKLDERRTQIHHELEDLDAETIQSKQEKIQAELGDLVRRQDQTRNDLSVVMSAIRETDLELERHHMMHVKYGELQSIYVGNLSRLGLVSAAEAATEEIDFPTNCPFCENELSAEKYEEYSGPVQEEAASTINELAILGEVQARNNARIEVLRGQLEGLKDRQRRLEDHLSNAVLPAIQSLQSDINGVQEFERLQAELAYLETKYLEMRDKLDEVRSPKEYSSTFDPASSIASSFFTSMTEYIRDILREVQFEDAGSASFDPETLDVVVRNKSKRSHGKGYRAFFNTVVFLALRRYFAEHAEHKPGIFVLDTPTLGLEHQKSGDNLVTRREEHTGRPAMGLLRNLFDHMIDSGEQSQLIILNNTEVTPTSDFAAPDTMELRFGAIDEGADRAGLLKTHPVN
ncbi:AAA family ATPase [Corynebacterium sp. sy039]|uniref:AAA family ATPase n=1 Tax=Corynebacterium sp. sy039 TaxID=2599641 RepID=UPI0011B4CB6F|nr:AAA family ATPase [Corynebacterium sp. sy039]QDZ42452.1 AAA family ATPase [Corynebacterium sp. sy039]